jgi:predicted lipase
MVLRLERFVTKKDAALQLPAGITQLFSDHKHMVCVSSYTFGGKVYVVCAFRGTIHPSEWKKDFMFDLVPFEYGVDCSVHKGFQMMYKQLRGDILLAVKQAAPAAVFVCGHSLGAALSLFLTIDLSTALPNPDIRTYTFAPPRAADSRCTDAVEALIGPTAPVKEWLQIVNCTDVVPLLPPAVSPNIWNPKQPLMYSHVLPLKFLRFSENLYSWQNNHSLSTYIHFLQTIFLKQ